MSCMMCKFTGELQHSGLNKQNQIITTHDGKTIIREYYISTTTHQS